MVNDRQVLTPHLVSFPFSYLLSLRDSRQWGERTWWSEETSGREISFYLLSPSFPTLFSLSSSLTSILFPRVDERGRQRHGGNDGCMTSLLLVSYPHLLVSEVSVGWGLEREERTKRPRERELAPTVRSLITSCVYTIDDRSKREGKEMDNGFLVYHFPSTVYFLCLGL